MAYQPYQDEWENVPAPERELLRAKATLRAALARYGRAQNAAEAQMAVLAMHEGVRQALRAWLLNLPTLTARQKENIQDPLTRFGELVDLALHHTDLFEGRRALWRDELYVLLDHRNTVAHPVEEMDGDTALAAATGWADMARRLWSHVIGGDPPDLRHPDPRRITTPPKPPLPPSLRPTLSFYADAATVTAQPPARRTSLLRRIMVMAAIYLVILALFALLGLYVLARLGPVMARF